MTQPMLFTPLDIRGLRLKNRVVVAPMHQYSAVEGFANDWHLVNAGRYAAGGAALVIMESTKIARNGCGTVGDTALWDDKFIPALARCAAFIKQHGARAGIQLGHSGRKARLSRPWEGGKPLTGNEPEITDWDGWELVAPSAVPHTKDSPIPRALSHNEVRDLAVKWGEAAARADKAGFDMLEIHAAHGYLIHQFLSPVANVRTDAYGGSELNRMRFALEVAECVRAAWPSEKPLFMRLSCEDDAGLGPDESVRLSKLLKEKGVDVIDCSSGGLMGSATAARIPRGYSFQVPFASEIRKQANIATMAVGLILHPQQAEDVLAAGHADIVAIGREVLFDPNWPLHAELSLADGGDTEVFENWPKQYGWWLERREPGLRKLEGPALPFRKS